jgi:hypothetical protein
MQKIYDLNGRITTELVVQVVLESLEECIHPTGDG